MNSDFVWEYTVRWFDSLSGYSDCKHKFFSQKQEAIEFAKKKRKEFKNRYGFKGPKPFIVKLITIKTAFKDDVKLEFLNKKELELVDKNYPTLVKY